MSENDGCVCVRVRACMRVRVLKSEWMVVWVRDTSDFSFLILCENLFSTDFPGFKHCLLYILKKKNRKTKTLLNYIQFE